MVEEDDGSLLPLFPRRLGQPVCDFFSKTGHCRFGEGCRFDHPLQFAVRLNLQRLPLRPGQVVCAHYARCGECKFGAACKWHHPALAAPPQPPQQPQQQQHGAWQR